MREGGHPQLTHSTRGQASPSEQTTPKKGELDPHLELQNMEQVSQEVSCLKMTMRPGSSLVDEGVK